MARELYVFTFKTKLPQKAFAESYKEAFHRVNSAYGYSITPDEIVEVRTYPPGEAARLA